MLAVEGEKKLAYIFDTTRIPLTYSTVQDRTELIHVLEYLNRSQELGLVLGGKEDGTAKLSVYCDASYAVHEDMKSHLGMYDANIIENKFGIQKINNDVQIIYKTKG